MFNNIEISVQTINIRVHIFFIELLKWSHPPLNWNVNLTYFTIMLDLWAQLRYVCACSSEPVNKTYIWKNYNLLLLILASIILQASSKICNSYKINSAPLNSTTWSPRSPLTILTRLSFDEMEILTHTTDVYFIMHLQYRLKWNGTYWKWKFTVDLLYRRTNFLTN